MFIAGTASLCSHGSVLRHGPPSIIFVGWLHLTIQNGVAGTTLKINMAPRNLSLEDLFWGRTFFCVVC